MATQLPVHSKLHCRHVRTWPANVWQLLVRSEALHTCRCSAVASLVCIQLLHHWYASLASSCISPPPAKSCDGPLTFPEAAWGALQLCQCCASGAQALPPTCISPAPVADPKRLQGWRRAAHPPGRWQQPDHHHRQWNLCSWRSVGGPNLWAPHPGLQREWQCLQAFSTHAHACMCCWGHVACRQAGTCVACGAHVHGSSGLPPWGCCTCPSGCLAMLGASHCHSFTGCLWGSWWHNWPVTNDSPTACGKCL